MIVMTGVYNYTWAQGEDLKISLIYSQTDANGVNTPVDLSGYSLKMQIGLPNNPTPVYTVDSTVSASGTVSMDSSGHINITIPRTVLLSGGDLYDDVSGLSGKTNFIYDIFIKSGGSSPTYKKVLKGHITIDKSVTLW